MKTSTILRQNKERILHRWIERVKKEVPEAQEQDYIALRDDVPDLLDDIANNIQAEQSEQNTHNSFDHGRLRATFEDYALSDVVREYRLLMQVVLETIDEVGVVSVSDRDQIIFAITRAIEEASEIFFQTRQEESEQAREEAEKMATQLEDEGQLRDNFIGTVTHDLRNPLANTLSLVDLLRVKAAEDATTTKLLNAIQLSMERADDLIHNLLDTNLIKSGAKLPITIERHDIVEMVRTSVTAFDKPSGRTIEMVDSPPTLVLDCDSRALRRALDNLISNAIKYGEGAVTVRCQPTGNDTVSLSVHNWGNPIPKDQLDKIFSRYYRADDQSAHLGWGLGLSLVRGIADAHGGSVAVSSSADEGTRFSMYLPLRAADG